MTNNTFSKKQINTILKNICSSYQLTPEYKMSTSGEFFVISLLNKKDEKFIAKIRQKKGKIARQRFINEIEIQKLLQTKTNFFTPSFLKGDISLTPEYLLYSFIPGFPLNDYYIYIGARATNRLLKSNFLDHILEYQKIKPTKKMVLEKKSGKDNLLYFRKSSSFLKKYGSESLLKKTENALKLHSHLLNNAPLVVAHGDLNPKNIILNKNKVSVIDWSDIHFNNPLFDLSMLYVYAWNRQEIMDKINSHIHNNFYHLEDPDKLHLLNRLIFIPHFLKILNNSITGIKQDAKNKIIQKNTEKELIETVKKAIDYQIKTAERLASYLLIWSPEYPLVKTIQKFSTFRGVYEFFKKNSKEIHLEGNWQKLTVKNLRLSINKKIQKLIAQYTIFYPKKTIKIMAKIRQERGDDLAKQSASIHRHIWQQTQPHPLVSQPLGYYPKYKLFLYQRKEGKPLSFLFEQKYFKNISQWKKMLPKIFTIFNKLHNIPLTVQLKKIHFTNNYDTKKQIDFFESYLPNTKDNKKLIQTLRYFWEKYGQYKTSLIHGDFQPENLIWHKNKFYLIDFDNSEIGDPLMDVGNFITQLSYKNTTLNLLLTMRLEFLKSYIKRTSKKKVENFNERLNFYIIMGHIKNFNYDHGINKYRDMKKNLNIIIKLAKYIKNDTHNSIYIATSKKLYE